MLKNERVYRVIATAGDAALIDAAIAAEADRIGFNISESQWLLRAALKAATEENRGGGGGGKKAARSLLRSDLGSDQTGSDQTGSDPDPPIVPQGGRKRVKASPDPDFDTWWDAWPNKVAKEAAKVAWARAKPDLPPIAEFLVLTASWIRAQRHDAICPYPATWLNGKRWLDEMPGANGTAKPAYVPGARIDYMPFYKSGDKI